ncbi:TolB-like protein [Anseongella ginsenosidimutans]|uniref:TolB-like protein n=1 Tax=Anseongella ginsenosidimutans TaxID=496056 RepID=A0A4R3KWX7_9SPHI|nr:helix-turn-helix domain-containing protein [Anseongella ginsenosidimutans]QEC51872.1 helix-turn-helix domain-containing protein [Anseongella ginsenosidimutans]TCS89256.1 TolB-like protein [Anseongella ginsenosidimutans]
MPDISPIDNNFPDQATAIVLENLPDERFGVSELAEKMHMSRSNLLRRIKQATGKSASQFIREVRLERAMELLVSTSFTVSEVSYQVGFGGTSYFIKCFREYYGYPPGEAGKRKAEEAELAAGREAAEGEIAAGAKNAPEARPLALAPSKRKASPWLMISAAAVLIVLLGAVAYYAWRPKPGLREKSIAVLPFKNESSDSANLYLINGLMESTLNNLQKIKDLRVVSRTSTEKYRHTARTIPELAEELDVSYVVEGSGQKAGNRILLHIQLIDARHDRHLWARQYEREITDIFQLQQEIAKDIAREVQAFVTWEEAKRIEKIPTTDLAAYDLFLKASDLMRQGGAGNLEQALAYLRQAITRDSDFALAYATSAIAYYYLDLFQTHKQYTNQLDTYSDKALLYDPSAPECLFAKALYYVHQKEYGSAVPYLEKALEFNPNSIIVIHFLSNFYNSMVPNTAKYLEYALQGIRLDPTAYDSVTTSYNYLHLSNALIQTGFVDESLEYIEKSLAYNPRNPYAGWVKAAVVYAKYRDPVKLEKLLLAELEKNPAALHILQELGKLYYHTGNYPAAREYYLRFIDLRTDQDLDIFQAADITIAAVWSKLGMREEAEVYATQFLEHAMNDESIYKHLQLAMYYTYRRNAQKTITHLREFAEEDNYQYWVLLFKDDPLVAPFRDSPAFKRVISDMEIKFWNNNRELRKTLEEKGLL